MSDCHFDEIATVYDESLPGHVVEHYLRKRVAFLAAVCPAAGSVLDVGCGTGALAQRLAARGHAVVGADPSEGMLQIMRGRAPQVRAVCASGTDLPFDAGVFDLVVTVAALHHIAAPDAVRATLSEMVRVCRPGGRIVVWDHNPRNPYWSSLMARVPQDTGEERLVPAAEVIDGLITGGAQVLSSQQLGLVPEFTPRRAMRAAAVIERWFERTPGVNGFAAHNVIVARPDGAAAAASALSG
jgi:SAM-dependent methyltransferase